MPNSPLDSTLPGYIKISEAPTLGMLEALSEKIKTPLSKIIEEEAQKEYKAISDPYTPHVAVWLCQNPALMEYQFVQGAKTLVRRKPKLLASGAKAVEALGRKQEKQIGSGKGKENNWAQDADL